MENTKKDIYILVRYPNDRLGVELWSKAYDMQKDGTVTELVGRASYDMQMLQATADKANADNAGRFTESKNKRINEIKSYTMNPNLPNSCIQNGLYLGIKGLKVVNDERFGKIIYYNDKRLWLIDVLTQYLWEEYVYYCDYNPKEEYNKTHYPFCVGGTKPTDEGFIKFVKGCGLQWILARVREMNESKNIKNNCRQIAEAQRTPIFTLNAMDITNDEGVEDMKFTAKTFTSEDEAIAAAKEMARQYADYDSVINISVMAGEYQMPSGDIYGEPDAIYTVSNKDRNTTAIARKNANFVNHHVDHYMREHKSFVTNPEFRRQIAEARVDFLVRCALKEEAVKQPRLIEITNNAQNFGILSAVSDKDRTQELLEDLKNLGCATIKQDGVYNGDHEISFIIIGISQHDLEVLAKKYNQHSYIFARRNTNSPCGYEFLAFVRRGEGDNITYQKTSMSIKISEFNDGSAQCYSYIPSADYYYNIQGLVFENKDYKGNNSINEDYATMGGKTDSFDINTFKEFIEKYQDLPGSNTGVNTSDMSLKNVLMLYTDLLQKVSNALNKDTYEQAYHWSQNIDKFIQRDDIEHANYSYKQSYKIVLNGLDRMK